MSKESRVLRVIFQGNEGYSTSVTHYYHFLFGPMKSMLCELPLNIVSLAGPKNTLSRKDAETQYPSSTSSLFILGNKTIALPAYDNFTESIFNDPHISHLKRPVLVRVLTWLRSRIPSYIRLLPTYDVLLIERTDKETYFRDVKAVIDRDRPSGSSLRRIDNHRELETALAAVCAGPGQGGKVRATFANVSLERCSIFYQLHLFSCCKVVVAQHGAALSNIAFMVDSDDGAAATDTHLGQGSSSSSSSSGLRATATVVNGEQHANKKPRHCKKQVIEVNPPPSYTASKEHFKKVARQHFRNLSSLAGVTYRGIWQEHDTAPVDVGQVVQALDEALNELGCIIHPSTSNVESSNKSSNNSGSNENGSSTDDRENTIIDTTTSTIDHNNV
eukprot:gene26856-35548_t